MIDNLNTYIDMLKEKSMSKRLRWNIHNCSICGAPVGYIFYKGLIYFDPSCDCVIYSVDPEERTWEDLINLLELNKGNNLIKDFIKFVEES